MEHARATAQKLRESLAVPGIDAEALRKELERVENRIRVAQMKTR